MLCACTFGPFSGSIRASAPLTGIPHMTTLMYIYISAGTWFQLTVPVLQSKRATYGLPLHMPACFRGTCGVYTTRQCSDTSEQRELSILSLTQNSPFCMQVYKCFWGSFVWPWFCWPRERVEAICWWKLFHWLVADHGTGKGNQEGISLRRLHAQGLVFLLFPCAISSRSMLDSGVSFAIMLSVSYMLIIENWQALRPAAIWEKVILQSNPIDGIYISFFWSNNNERTSVQFLAELNQKRKLTWSWTCLYICIHNYMSLHMCAYTCICMCARFSLHLTENYRSEVFG